MTVQVAVHFLHRFFGFEGDTARVEREDSGRKTGGRKGMERILTTNPHRGHLCFILLIGPNLEIWTPFFKFGEQRKIVMLKFKC